MTTETVLTTQEILHEYHGTDTDLDFARAIEQAVLQSHEVQALISAAQEFSDLYGWLWDTTEGGGFLSPDGVKRYDAAHHNLKVALCKITGRPLPIDPDEDDE